MSVREKDPGIGGEKIWYMYRCEFYGNNPINNTIKNEFLRGVRFTCIDEVRAAVAKAVDFYNNERPHIFHNGYAAECWSPQDGKLKQLVDITRAMKEAVQKNDNTIIQDILPEVQSLSREFLKLGQDWAASQSLDLAF